MEKVAWGVFTILFILTCHSTPVCPPLPLCVWSFSESCRSWESRDPRNSFIRELISGCFLCYVEEGRARRRCSWLVVGLALAQICFHLFQFPLCHIQWLHSDRPSYIVDQISSYGSYCEERGFIREGSVSSGCVWCETWSRVVKNPWKTSLMCRADRFHKVILQKKVVNKANKRCNM